MSATQIVVPAGVGRGSRGDLLILAWAVAFSTAGYFARLIHRDVWTVLFWRGIFGRLFIAGCIVWYHRGATLDAVGSIGRIGLLVAACSTISTICCVNALRLTTVADVNIFYATAPFVAAALAWLWTGARERRSTLLASLVALCGVAVMFDAARLYGHIFGDLLAVTMMVLLAAMIVAIRHKQSVSLLSAAFLSAFLSAIAVLPLAHPAVAIGPQFIQFVLFGTTQFGLGLLLLTLGARLISAPRSALIGALEVPLACVGVWLAFDEVPSTELRRRSDRDAGGCDGPDFWDGATGSDRLDTVRRWRRHAGAVSPGSANAKSGLILGSRTLRPKNRQAEPAEDTPHDPPHVVLTRAPGRGRLNPSPRATRLAPPVRSPAAGASATAAAAPAPW